MTAPAGFLSTLRLNRVFASSIGRAVTFSPRNSRPINSRSSKRPVAVRRLPRRVIFTLGNCLVNRCSARSALSALNVREMVTVSGIAAILEDSAVAINGEIVNDPTYEPVPAGAEIYFVTKAAGG